MSAILRQQFAYLGRLRQAAGGAELAARSAHVRFERGDWSDSLSEVERTTRCVDSFTRLLNGEEGNKPDGINLDTPEVRSYIARADDARRAAMVVGGRLAPVQKQWGEQTASTGRYPLNGWKPANPVH
ncbi:hypothetical protein AB0331_13935 [Dietzia maris]|uniref:hypothetical protein n=1 Tax=Dietzia maris TaxID=37915 RepID=UPI00344C8840